MKTSMCRFVAVGAVCLLAAPICWAQADPGYTAPNAPAVKAANPNVTKPAEGMPKLTAPQMSALSDIILGELEMQAYSLGDKTKAGGSARVAGGYARAGSEPNAQPALLSQALGDFYRLKQGAKGAAQVSQAADEVRVQLDALQVMQNRRLIEQNDRIIALLEQLVKSPK